MFCLSLQFRDTVLNQVPTCSHKLRNDLCRGIPRVWRNYYMLDKDKDVAFEVGHRVVRVFFPTTPAPRLVAPVVSRFWSRGVEEERRRRLWRRG